MANLNDKQMRFVQEYLVDLNSTQACIRAGYSPKTAGEQGSRLLKNVKISKAVDQAMAERSKRTGVNQDRIVNELAKIAFAKLTDIVDSKGNIRARASDDDLACIESYKVKDSDVGSEREVKLCSKLKALELLGKHCGMWNDKLKVDVNLPIFFDGEHELQE